MEKMDFDFNLSKREKKNQKMEQTQSRENRRL